MEVLPFLLWILRENTSFQNLRHVLGRSECPDFVKDLRDRVMTDLEFKEFFDILQTIWSIVVTSIHDFTFQVPMFPEVR